MYVGLYIYIYIYIMESTVDIYINGGLHYIYI